LSVPGRAAVNRIPLEKPQAAKSSGREGTNRRRRAFEGRVMPPDEKADKSKTPKRNIMSQTSSPQPAQVSAPPRRARAAPGSRKEDWIGNQLQQVYEEALREAIPQRMVDLLKALDDGDAKDGEEK
jgi:hypothetical protein